MVYTQVKTKKKNMFYKVGHSTSNSVFDKKMVRHSCFYCKNKISKKKVWKEKNFVPGHVAVTKYGVFLYFVWKKTKKRGFET